jgi:hypothetical protein
MSFTPRASTATRAGKLPSGIIRYRRGSGQNSDIARFTTRCRILIYSPKRVHDLQSHARSERTREHSYGSGSLSQRRHL